MAPTEIAYGLTRMHSLLLAETEQQIRVFRQMNDALLWLDSDGRARSAWRQAYSTSRSTVTTSSTISTAIGMPL